MESQKEKKKLKMNTNSTVFQSVHSKSTIQQIGFQSQQIGNLMSLTQNQQSINIYQSQSSSKFDASQIDKTSLPKMTKKLKLSSNQDESKKMEEKKLQLKKVKKAKQRITGQQLRDLLELVPNGLDENDQFDIIIRNIQYRQEKFEEIKTKKKPNQRQAQSVGGFQKGQNFQKQQSYNQQQEQKQQQQQYISNYHLVRAPPDLLKQKLLEQANHWTTKMKDEQDELIVEQKKIKFILNKITPENYDKLFQEILGLLKDRAQQVPVLTELIIKKSWEDKNYCRLYAQLCKQLMDTKSLNELQSFKSEMLQRIQKTFEGEIKVVQGAKQVEEMNIDEKAEYENTLKRRTLNNFRFIAELYNSGFSNRIILYDCFYRQFSSFNQEYYQFKVKNDESVKKFENQLEALLLLIDIAGKKLEQDLNYEKLRDKEKQKDQKKVDEFMSGLSRFYEDCVKQGSKREFEEFNKEVLSLISYGEDRKFINIEQIFEILKIMKRDGELSKRMQAIITNLVQKKDENWQERFMKGDGPKKLNQIHEEHEQNLERIDEKAEQHYQNRRQNYNNYDRHQYQEVTYEAVEVPVSKKKRKQSYQGLLASDIEEKMKEINKKLDYQRVDPTDMSSQEYGFQDYYKDYEVLFRQSEVIVFMEKYLSLFSDGRKENIKRRLGLIWRLYEEKHINVEQIKNEIQNNLHKHWQVADDFPEMVNSYCYVIYQFLEKKLISLESLNFKLDDCEDDEIKEMKQYFFQNIIEKIIKKHKENNVEMNHIDSFLKVLEDVETEEPKLWLKQNTKIII